MEHSGHEEAAGIFDNIEPEMLMKIMEIMEMFSEAGCDKNTELLTALRPHLRPENRSKIDTAMKISQFLKILPKLKESGLF